MSFLNEYTFAFIAGWILPSALLGLLGDSRLIGFWKSIWISLLLSPLLGLIAVLSSKSKQTDEFEKEMLKELKIKRAGILSEELGKLHSQFTSGQLNEDEYKKAKSKLLT